MKYDRYAKPTKPFMVIHYGTSTYKVFKSLERATDFAIKYSKKVRDFVYLTEPVLKSDGYRCVIKETYKDGIFIDASKGAILLHYIFYYFASKKGKE